MCGIAGAVGVNVSPQMIAAMQQAMYHRGPDDGGSYLDEGIGLAFRRLAIVDLSGGQQPMSNEDGRIQLLFNGEIYDHHLLRQALVQCGHHFVTDHSDTEVLVHGWEEWGYDLFPRLNGMFAIAIWECDTRRLILARDRYGIKPLYYAPLPDGALAFGSEMKAIFASGLVAAQPSAEGMLEYFAFQNLWREQTMFAGISQLPPGTVLTWQDGQCAQRQYWDITFPRSKRASLDALAEEHRSILKRVIKRQIAADVPVMSYLSGGIDSTSITVASYQVDPQVTAYSCIFDLKDVGQDAFVDEREYSRLVAQTYDLRRVEMELPQDILTRTLDGYVTALEDLRMGIGYQVYLIAQRVAQDAKVVLSGTGGDEFHAGYWGRYNAITPGDGASMSVLQRMRRALKDMALYSPFSPWRRPRPSGPQDIYRNILNFLVRPDQITQAFTSEFMRSTNGFDSTAVINDFIARVPSQDWRDRVMYVDAKTYLNGLLVLEDKVSMAHSLETRVPLLDNELVDFVLDVPFERLYQGDTGKIVFRESVRPWVPDEIYRKPKMGFGTPESSWYRGQLRPWVEATLNEQTIQARGVFQPKFVRNLLDDHFAGRVDWGYFIWSLLNFEHWCRAFGFFGG